MSKVKRVAGCKACATRARRGFEGQCPACAGDRTRQELRQGRTAGVEMAAHEEAVRLIVSHKVQWCRARLMHALAGANEQGTVLIDVLEELLPGEEMSHQRIATALHVWQRVP